MSNPSQPLSNESCKWIGLGLILGSTGLCALGLGLSFGYLGLVLGSLDLGLVVLVFVVLI